MHYYINQMKTRFLLIGLLFAATISLKAQDSQDIDDSSIKGQFVEVIDKSNNYQEFKVIKKTQLATLRKNILDSISNLEKEIVAKDETIASQSGKISNLENKLASTQESLTISMGKEDGISLFGIPMQKTAYNTLLFSIIGFLLLALLLFIYKYNSSNSITKEANAKFDETEAAFEAYRQKKLEDEQVLRRKLQDEINKNR
ncbi:hypothetical protein ULMA_14610 [Patiriisocius marinus]|uniref:tRNA (Guanine-N1)-methyltransferase n=2 Tax=Patiriisocius marinus TaxID=1397112 RepID=A0A5J4J0P3_9FLAO|nr:hypothetical protein ULMA_14610 [Patiriisocius marinus]